jgi:hypothetical protein
MAGAPGTGAAACRGCEEMMLAGRGICGAVAGGRLRGWATIGWRGASPPGSGCLGPVRIWPGRGLDGAAGRGDTAGGLGCAGIAGAGFGAAGAAGAAGIAGAAG